jgi:hypothetical protein
MFRFGGVFATVLFLISAGIVGCGDSSSEPETITNRVYLPEKIEAATGGFFAVPVNFDNEVSLSAINVPMLFPSSILRLDSVSFRDSRADQFMFKNVLAKADTISIGVVDDSAAVATGRGLLATIYFTVRPTAPDTTFLLNTFDYPLLPFSFFDLQLNPVVNPPQFKACTVHINGQTSKEGGGGKPN